jgi:hypothetical protein
MNESEMTQPSEAEKFDLTVRKILSVSHDEMVKRDEDPTGAGYCIIVAIAGSPALIPQSNPQKPHQNAGLAGSPSRCHASR